MKSLTFYSTKIIPLLILLLFTNNTNAQFCTNCKQQTRLLKQSVMWLETYIENLNTLARKSARFGPFLNMHLHKLSKEKEAMECNNPNCILFQKLIITPPFNTNIQDYSPTWMIWDLFQYVSDNSGQEEIMGVYENVITAESKKSSLAASIKQIQTASSKRREDTLAPLNALNNSLENFLVTYLNRNTMGLFEHMPPIHWDHFIATLLGERGIVANFLEIPENLNNLLSNCAHNEIIYLTFLYDMTYPLIIPYRKISSPESAYGWAIETLILDTSFEVNAEKLADLLALFPPEKFRFVAAFTCTQ